MTTERIRRSVHVETALLPDDLRSALSQCGEIRGIYAAGNTEGRVYSQYYVEYRDTKGVKRACALQLPGTSLQTLEASPDLVERFYSVLSPDLPPKPHTTVLTKARSSPYRKQQKKSRLTQQTKDKQRPATYTVLEPISASHTSSYHPALRSGSFDKENLPSFDSVSSLPWIGHMTEPGFDIPPFAPAYTPQQGNQPLSFSLSGFTDMSSSSSGLSITSYENEECTPPPRILLGSESPHLSFQRHHTHIQVDDLNDCPTEIIQILKDTASDGAERGKWMMVAAHYRKRGNLDAAIAVVSAMVDMMLSVGMGISDLKPAVLMLSSCHLDVARRERTRHGADTTESKLHFEQACAGFRTLYGAYEPPSMGNLDESSPETCRPAATEPLVLSAAAQSERFTTPISAPTGLQGAPVIPAGSVDTPSTSARRGGRIRLLEREIQSLRDRQRNQKQSLERTRSSKRKLEDDLEGEQTRRRRLEVQLEDAEQVIVSAQREEEYVREQCRVEAEKRRRAEDRLDELRRQMEAIEPRAVENEERERKMKELFGKLGVAFLKAARSDTVDLPTLNVRL